MTRTAPPLQVPSPDGRRERSRSSRSRIVAAMIELVGSGDHAPSAARVAETAGVGLRTVFRHYDDMDTLFREMSEIITASILPIIQQAPQGDSWKARLGDIADRRARVFEAIMPYRLSADLKRFQSPYLMEDQRRMLRMESEAIDAHLPAALATDAVASRGIKIILGFQTWRSLRHDMQLPMEEAREVVRRLLDDCLAAMPDE